VGGLPIDQILESRSTASRRLITFIPACQPLPEAEYRYRTPPSEELAAVLRELPKRPLLAGEEGIRLSLTGA
jgi:serine/threonine-protein kinase HipA